MPQPTFIAGIDCATDPSRIGLALGLLDESGLHLVQAVPCDRKTNVVALLAAWIRAHSPLLLAMDAPLGWPKAMAERLPVHRAGQPLGATPDQLFARASDRWIAEKVKKRPLEIGANLIARTAHAALELLHSLRTKTGEQLPLLWQQGPPAHSGVIEVYPAATLRTCIGSKPARHSRKGDSDSRRHLAKLLERQCGWREYQEAIVGSAHLLDAAICVLAGGDFVEKRCWPPEDLSLAEQEGWIWVRRCREELAR
jgi:hypothetical protein